MDPSFGSGKDGPVHGHRIGSVKAARDIGRGDQVKDLIVAADPVMTEAFSKVGVDIDTLQCDRLLSFGRSVLLPFCTSAFQYFSLVFRVSVISICPGAWVMAMSGFVFMMTFCGVTPHGQKTGTSPSFIVTMSP